MGFRRPLSRLPWPCPRPRDCRGLSLGLPGPRFIFIPRGLGAPSSGTSWLPLFGCLSPFVSPCMLSTSGMRGCFNSLKTLSWPHGSVLWLAALPLSAACSWGGVRLLQLFPQDPGSPWLALTVWEPRKQRTRGTGVSHSRTVAFEVCLRSLIFCAENVQELGSENKTCRNRTSRGISSQGLEGPLLVF